MFSEYHSCCLRVISSVSVIILKHLWSFFSCNLSFYHIFWHIQNFIVDLDTIPLNYSDNIAQKMIKPTRVARWLERKRKDLVILAIQSKTMYFASVVWHNLSIS
jgi:hypothetical protein